jgi:hypothetical protein
MNERIRKLALETDAWCDQNWAGHEFYNIRWEEKFAELIVRECVKVVLDEDGKEWAGYVHVCREESAGMIKKHFGVEE